MVEDFEIALQGKTDVVVTVGAQPILTSHAPDLFCFGVDMFQDFDEQAHFRRRRSVLGWEALTDLPFEGSKVLVKLVDTR